MLVLLVLTGCGPADGAEGGECINTGSILHPAYSCDAGLVCNSGRSPKTCEQPNSNDLGAPCGSDNNCLETLYCPVTGTCTARIKEGDPCPAGMGCQQGLVCKKDASGATCQKP
jgi:hypothetical protein